MATFRKYKRYYIADSLLGKLPAGREVARQLLAREGGANQLDRDGVLAQDGVVEGAVGHLARVDELFAQSAELHPAEHVSALIERIVSAAERPTDLGRRVVDFVSDAFDQKVDALLRR